MENLERRGFLRGLVALPLIGGGVTLIGQPTAVAAPVTFDLLEEYKTWLHFEHRSLTWEMALRPEAAIRYRGDDRSEIWHEISASHWLNNAAGSFHSFGGTEASERAALVLSAVGCNWRGEQGS